MLRPKRVLVVMNMATAGRSSMAAVLPVLAACHAQGCPLPTALLSSHLGGFGEVACLPVANQAYDTLGRLATQQVHFDAIYTGYLLSEEEYALAHRAMDLFPKAYKLVDPALGDGGRLYSKTTPAMVQAMQALARRADCITPNLTESALLLNENPATPADEATALARLEALSQGRSAVITSAPVAKGTGIVGKSPGGKPFTLPTKSVPGSYPGTGDLFAAALCGGLVYGGSLRSRTAKAAGFVEAAVSITHKMDGEVRQGVWFEPLLGRLAAQAGEATL